ESAPGKRLDERVDDRGQRAHAVDDNPRAADEEHDRDDVGRRDETARYRDRRRERTDRRTARRLIRSGDHDPASRRGIVATRVLACRKNPREGGRNDDGHTEEDDGMRKTPHLIRAAREYKASAETDRTLSPSAPL